MASTGLELNIALLGNSTSGKKTLLHSLLRHGGCSSAHSALSPGDVARYTVTPGHQSADKENGPAYSAEHVGEDTTVTLEQGSVVRERNFKVGTAEELVSMLPGTSFTFSVVPPLDFIGCEAYVAQKWESWDTVIVLIDGAAGISDDDNKLLKHIKKQNEKETKRIVVVCNKIDDTESERLCKHVKKASSKVKKIFGVDGELNEPSADLSFISMSATRAFVYRTGSQMSVEAFKEFDRDLVTMVGKDHFGSKNWKKLTDDEKSKKLHAAIAGDPKTYESAIVDCGFKEFMAHFDFYLGGADNQKKLIQKNLDKALSKVCAFQTEWISYSLFAIYGKESRVLHGKANQEELKERSQAIQKKFWEVYETYHEGTFGKFVQAFPERVKVVVDPIQELIYYHKIVEIAGWDEQDAIETKMKDIVRKYLIFLIKKEHETQGNTVWEPISGISPLDWSIIWRSILLLRHEKLFRSTYSDLILLIDELAPAAAIWKSTGLKIPTHCCPHCFTQMDKTKKEPPHFRCKSCSVVFLEAKFDSKMSCAYCKNQEVSPENRTCKTCQYLHEEHPKYEEWIEFSYDENCKAVPAFPEKFSKIVHLSIPDSLDDPNHFGHPIHKLCEFLASVGEKKDIASDGDDVAGAKSVAKTPSMKKVESV